MSIYTIICLCQILICMLNAGGFVYPNMPDPISFHEELNALTLEVDPFEIDRPLLVRIGLAFDLAAFDCIAYYHDSYLSALTRERPFIAIPPSADTRSSNTRALCYAYAAPKLANFFFKTKSKFSSTYIQSVTTELATRYGLMDPIPSVYVRDDVKACNQDPVCLNDVAVNGMYFPEIIGSIIADSIIYAFRNDGWNQAGSLVFDKDKGDIAECSANCKSFIDFEGYIPFNIPYENKKSNQKNWQPASVTNERGGFYYQRHSVPFVAYTGTKYLFDGIGFIEAEKPTKFDYDYEANLVIERLTTLATNDEQKAMVELFDNHVIVAGLIVDNLRNTYADLTYEQYIMFCSGMGFAGYRAILQTWSQKVYFDQARPTSYIQQMGDVEIETYGGAYQGVQTIKARDFESYVPVPPSSAYPSATACLCTVFQEFTDAFIGGGGSLSVSVNVEAGSSMMEPGTTPQQDITLSFVDMSDLAQKCGESRLWGGLQFTPGVEESNRICQGIGAAAMQRMQEVTCSSGGAMLGVNGGGGVPYQYNT